MTAYYNEIDPFAAAWLRELIAGGHIAPGVVDERDVRDVMPSDIADFTQCHFFAGIGVWSYALRLAGWPDERPIWTGSCPCQPFSAGSAVWGKGHGVDDSRHLWPAWRDLIEARRPIAIIGEQVARNAGFRWFDIVSDDLEKISYASGAVTLAAASVGAPHERERIFWLANANRDRLERCAAETLPGSWWKIERDAVRCGDSPLADADWLECCDGAKRPVESGTFPLVNGLAGRVGRLRGYGNAIVAPVAAEFIKAVMDTLA